MALVKDTPTTTAPASVAGNSHTFSHTVNSNSNRYLVLVIGTADNVNAITSVTYNGVAMTSLVSEASPAYCTYVVYYLANPSSGSNNVVVTWAGTGNYINAIAYSFYNCSGVASRGASALAASPHSQTATISSGSILIVGGMGTFPPNKITIDGTTWNAPSIDLYSAAQVYVEYIAVQSSATIASSGSKTCIVSATDVPSWTVSNIRVEVLESAAAPVTSSRRSRCVVVG